MITNNIRIISIILSCVEHVDMELFHLSSAFLFHIFELNGFIAVLTINLEASGI